jgi:hypothetical protein
MPHPRRHGTHPDKHWIPLEDWSDYLDVPEPTLDEMTLEELTALADKLKVERDKIETMIEERKAEEERE